ncbi:hypothetical protein AB205_0037860 [Aquarana catesbeiana]|uniref:Uncharacterized protein n=1 Tax=Aquarana catesbeiana TaxID=8400 RepID=A0A2G9SIL1_AQUCT|nr:hypothetical protein AB205_0037860 [Aquarana catesbeiana]
MRPKSAAAEALCRRFGSGAHSFQWAGSGGGAVYTPLLNHSKDACRTFSNVLQAHRSSVKPLKLSHWGCRGGIFQALL